MKQTSIRDLRTRISRSFAALAMGLLVMAYMSPDVFEQIVTQHSYHNSPLGIMSSIEQMLFGVLAK